MQPFDFDVLYRKGRDIARLTTSPERVLSPEGGGNVMGLTHKYGAHNFATQPRHIALYLS